MIGKIVICVQNALIGAIDSVVRGLRAAQRGIRRFF